MKPYSIYKNDEGTIKAVKQGFSWPGWFFVWFWCFYKKLYLHAFDFLLINLFVLHYTDSNNWKYLFQFIIMAIIGFKGNHYLEKKLIKSCFVYVDTISATNTKSAVSTFIENNDPQFDK